MKQNDPIKIAQDALSSGSVKLFDIFPSAIKIIIKNRLWQGRNNDQGTPFQSFEEFALHRLWEGLEIPSMGRLIEYVKDDPEAVKMVQEEMAWLKHVGGNNNPEGIGGKSGKECKQDCQGYIVTLTKFNRGNKSEYLLKRLKRDNPVIAKEFIEGKYKSVRQAAIMAGIVKVPSAFEQVVKLVERLTNDERIKLKELL